METFYTTIFNQENNFIQAVNNFKNTIISMSSPFKSNRVSKPVRAERYYNVNGQLINRVVCKENKLYTTLLIRVFLWPAVKN